MLFLIMVCLTVASPQGCSTDGYGEAVDADLEDAAINVVGEEGDPAVPGSSERSQRRCRQWFTEVMGNFDDYQQVDILKKILSRLRTKDMYVPGIVDEKEKYRASCHVWTARQLRYQVNKVFSYLKTKEALRLCFPVILKERITDICTSELER
jgi:hypothetical protein